MLIDQCEFVNLLELQEAAKKVLPAVAFDYYASGANDEVTLRRNREDYDCIELRPRMLVDVSDRTLAVSVMGADISMPVIVAPTAFQRLAHEEGELATTRAAGRAGTIMTLSTLATSSIEEVMSVATGPVWFQLYVYKDKGITRSLVERATASGCKAIVLTVDSPMLGRRERDVRNRFSLPPHLSVRNLFGSGMAELPSDVPDSGLAAYISSLYDTSLTWKDVEWLRSITNLPVLVKGILRADDAQLAVQHGAAGVVVSNHGGRQLDTAVSTISALPEVVQAIGNNAEVFVDGGIRRGTDVLKALAFGARAVLLGRPVLWGLALNGEEGVLNVLNLLRQEVDLAMALSGCNSAREIPADLAKWSR